MAFIKQKSREEEKKKGGVPLGAGAASRAAAIGVRGAQGARGLAGLGAFLTSSNFGAVVMIMTGVLGIAAAAGSHYMSARLAAQAKAKNDAERARAMMAAGRRRSGGSVASGGYGDGLSMLSAANRADEMGAGAGAGNGSGRTADNSADNQDQNQKDNSQNDAPQAADQNIGASKPGTSAFGSRFGQLSSGSSSSSGLVGGSGLSGGIGRSFSPGQTGGFGVGNLTAMARGATPSAGKVSSSRSAGFNSRNASLQRLGRMNGAMKNATGLDGQGQSQVHTDQWSSAPAQNGQVGPAAGAIGGGTGAGAGVSPDAPAPNDGPISGGGAGSAPGGASYNPPPISNVGYNTPYQSMINMAEMLITIASMLLLAAFLVSLAEKIWPPAMAIATALASAAAACAAVVTAIGIMMMTIQGQKTQGTMFLIVGGLLTAIAVVAAIGYAGAASAQSTAAGAAEAAKGGATGAITDPSVVDIPEAVNPYPGATPTQLPADAPSNMSWDGSGWKMPTNPSTPAPPAPAAPAAPASEGPDSFVMPGI